VIEGLDDLLEREKQPGIVELSALLQELLGGILVSGRLIDEEKLLRSRVYRLNFEIGDDVHSLIVKRFKPDRSQREQLVARRWLSSVGLGTIGPPLLGTAAERTGQWIWHVYEDLGDWTLDQATCKPQWIQAAVEKIAQLHLRFAGHQLLGECRSLGGDLGIFFFRSSVTDAIRALDALHRCKVVLSWERQALRDHLLERLHRIVDEMPHRVGIMTELGGPETLLHGDLWTTNVLVLPKAHELEVRLIDWDHTGVGFVSYDLSTFLLRFPIEDRKWILGCYQDSVRELNWVMPKTADLNLLFDTAEQARLANALLWPAIAASESQAEWAFDELAEIEGWFEKLQPVLPLAKDENPNEVFDR
jgi:thiamine kinase-like enzyme